MKKKVSILAGVGVLLLAPGLVCAGCVDFSAYAGVYAIEGNNTVVLYAENRPIGRFGIQCDIQSPSVLRVQLLKTTVCDGDEVLVDGKTCFANNVTSTN